MCDPVTLTVLTVAATVVTAGSQLYAGAAQASQAKYEAKIADRNASYEREAIKDAQSRRNIDQLRHWRRVSQQMGEQRAALGGSGLDVNFGAPADIVEDTLQIGMEDSQTINENYAKEVKGYDINAANYTMQARGLRAQAKQAKIGSYIGAAGTLLSGASQVARLNTAPSSASFGPKSQGFVGPPG